MQHEQIPGTHPFFQAILSAVFIIASYTAPEIAEHKQWHIPPIVMECFQVGAWGCAIGMFVIAALNYLGIKWNPFKKKK
jgi:uncharacterized membrane protein YccC